MSSALSSYHSELKPGLQLEVHLDQRAEKSCNILRRNRKGGGQRWLCGNLLYPLRNAL